MNRMDKAESLLAELALLLGKPIPMGDANACWEQVFEFHSVQFRLAMAAADATVTHLERLQQVLLPKDATYTELDRTTTQNAGSAVTHAMTERMADMQRLVDQRIQLLQDYVAFLFLEPDTTNNKDKQDGESQTRDQGDTETDEAGPKAN
jgi:hypothetical protein